MKVLAKGLVLCGMVFAAACGRADLTAPAAEETAPAIGRAEGGFVLPGAFPDSTGVYGGDGGGFGIGSGG